MSVELGIILACVVAIISGQLMFKIVGLELAGTGLMGLASNMKAAAILIAALAIYGLATIAWVWVLQTVPLSRAYLFMSLSFAAIPFLAHWLFGEDLSARAIVGSGLIVAGVVITATDL
jgi:drug/metabolite transporter (DMT)-like permease